MRTLWSSMVVRRLARHWLGLLLALACLLAGPPSSVALEPIPLDAETEKIDLSTLGEHYQARGDRLLVETAPSADGIVARIEVKAVNAGTDPNWIVFALRNTTDRVIERWLTADRYNFIGSGIVLPDLDAPRLRAVTPSLGFVPEAVPDDRADVFRITIDPDQTVTYVVEVASDAFPTLMLWKPQVYEKRQRDRTLFNGIMLGFTGLLAIFLTAVFAANHRAIFPTAALVAWSAVAYFCVDFGFWHKIFQLPPSDNALYRAASESAIVASLVAFLFVFLKLSSWHRWVRSLFYLWMLGQLALVAASVLDPKLAATFARLSFVLLAGLGSLLVVYLALRGQDRALALAPSWLFFLIWLFGAGLAAIGRLNGELVAFGLISGLVVILVLISFSVTQFAFRGSESAMAGSPGELQSSVMAIDAASCAIWEWNSRRDEIHTGLLIEDLLGLPRGELSCRVEDWCKHLHPSDRDRFRLSLVSLQENNGGNLAIDLRMRRNDSTYRWFELKAASVPQSDHRTMKCVGLIRDITSTKRAHERLVHDAIHDNLTGLPNRELFLDRLNVAIQQAKQGKAQNPTVLLIDIDRFKNVNSGFGLIVADSMLLTIARRLQRHLGPQDTLARVGGDKFAILVASDPDARAIAMSAERVRRSLRTPMKIAGKEIILTGSLGIAVYDGEQAGPHDVLREAEAAVHRAKRGGTDRIEIFKPSMRAEADQRVMLESELRRAVERRQIKIMYQPIMQLANDDLVGFEALVRWEHPRLGELAPADFIPIAEEAGIVAEIGGHVLTRAAKEAARWHKALPRESDPLFVSVNVSTRQLFRQDLVQEIRNILGRETVAKGTLKLEITESLVMENPERAAEVLEWLRSAGAGIALDDFGTGYSSLGYLSRFAFDIIKLDRSFVHEAAMDPASTAVVRSIVALARELGKVIVAEGVESEQDAVFLRSIGCTYAQGYLYGEPLTESAVIRWLEAIHREDKRSGKRGGLLGLLARLRAGWSGEEPAAEGAAAPSDTTPPASGRPGAGMNPGASQPAGPVPLGTPATSAPRWPAPGPQPATSHAGAPVSGVNPNAGPAPQRPHGRPPHASMMPGTGPVHAAGSQRPQAPPERHDHGQPPASRPPVAAPERPSVAATHGNRGNGTGTTTPAAPGPASGSARVGVAVAGLTGVEPPLEDPPGAAAAERPATGKPALATFRRGAFSHAPDVTPPESAGSGKTRS